MAVTGVDFIIAVNTGTSGSPVYTDVGGQRGASLSRSVGTASTTSKDSNGWSEKLQTTKEWSISGDGLLLETDAGFLELESWFDNDTILQVRFTTQAGNTYIGNAILTSLNIDGPMEGEASISYTLEGTAAYTKA